MKRLFYAVAVIALVSCAEMETEYATVSFTPELKGVPMTRSNVSVQDFIATKLPTGKYDLTLTSSGDTYTTKSGELLTVPVGTYHISGSKFNGGTTAINGCTVYDNPLVVIDDDIDIHKSNDNITIDAEIGCVAFVFDPTKVKELRLDGTVISCICSTDFYVVFVALEDEHTLTAVAVESSDYVDTDFTISGLENGYFYRIEPSAGEYEGYLLINVGTIQEGTL